MSTPLPSLTPELLQDILSTKWNIEVRRPGFVQSKMIVIEAEIRPLQLTPNITIGYTSGLWVNDLNPYRKDQHAHYAPLLDQAFSENPQWPLSLVQRCEDHAKKLEIFLEELGQNWNEIPDNEKLLLFKKYVELLFEIQHYYVIAVPLTTYAEPRLQATHPHLLAFAHPYQKLDIDRLHQSLLELKRAHTNHDPNFGSLLEEHIQNFSWITAAYNILTPYTKESVLAELKNVKPHEQTQAHSEEKHPLLTAIQVSIYLRNRIKEASQQLWFAIEPLAQNLAEQFGISRDQFFQLLHQEVYEALEQGQLKVSHQEIDARSEGLLAGFIKGKEFFSTDKAATDQVEDFLNRDHLSQYHTGQVKGQIARKGKVTGIARIILNPRDFAKLQPGDILVTAMTTPDFVPIMKRAAAIVTDEGGIACHAAIMSRELGIPCVIGTKVATQVLQDGAMIEVDANSGLVHRL